MPRSRKCFRRDQYQTLAPRIEPAGTANGSSRAYGPSMARSRLEPITFSTTVVLPNNQRSLARCGETVRQFLLYDVFAIVGYLRLSTLHYAGSYRRPSRVFRRLDMFRVQRSTWESDRSCELGTDLVQWCDFLVGPF